MKKLLAAALILFSSSIAFADVGPPPGQKSVNFSFTVKGITAADRTLFAFPCGTSSGAPIAEHAKIEEGRQISVGRRGGSCTSYSIDKAKYEEWAKTYKPSHEGTDPALDALAAQSVKCTGAPSPVFTVSTSDKRSSIEETLKVTKL